MKPGSQAAAPSKDSQAAMGCTAVASLPGWPPPVVGQIPVAKDTSTCSYYRVPASTSSSAYTYLASGGVTPPESECVGLLLLDTSRRSSNDACCHTG